MNGYWVITEKGDHITALLLYGFRYTSDFNYTIPQVHISLGAKLIYNFEVYESPDAYDFYIKDFDINKYNQLQLLLSLGIPIEEAFKEIE